MRPMQQVLKAEVMVMRKWLIQDMMPILFAVIGLTGCIRIKPDPVEVKPIHITVDVNVRMERDLQDFFREIDEQDPTMGKGTANE